MQNIPREGKSPPAFSLRVLHCLIAPRLVGFFQVLLALVDLSINIVLAELLPLIRDELIIANPVFNICIN